MVKRVCVLYPDGSLTLVAAGRSEAAQVNEARRLRDGFNKGERNKAELASFGEVEVDLMSFRERC